jgi:hypothetical protein
VVDALMVAMGDEDVCVLSVDVVILVGISIL